MGRFTAETAETAEKPQREGPNTRMVLGRLKPIALSRTPFSSFPFLLLLLSLSALSAISAVSPFRFATAGRPW